MKLQSGKFYRLRNGEVVGPLEFDGSQRFYPFSYLSSTWTDNGRYIAEETKDQLFDIVEEIHPVRHPIETDRMIQEIHAAVTRPTLTDQQIIQLAEKTLSSRIHLGRSFEHDILAFARQLLGETK